MIQANCLVRRDSAAAIDFLRVTLATRHSAATPETESRKACRRSSAPLLPTQATRIATVNTSSSAKKCFAKQDQEQKRLTQQNASEARQQQVKQRHQQQAVQLQQRHVQQQRGLQEKQQPPGRK
jgi:hypothetical protein